jgi:hypothetical protein
MDSSFLSLIAGIIYTRPNVIARGFTRSLDRGRGENEGWGNSDNAIAFDGCLPNLKCNLYLPGIRETTEIDIPLRLSQK